jgi:hypothetical protein
MSAIFVKIGTESLQVETREYITKGYSSIVCVRWVLHGGCLHCPARRAVTESAKKKSLNPVV